MHRGKREIAFIYDTLDGGSAVYIQGTADEYQKILKFCSQYSENPTKFEWTSYPNANKHGKITISRK